MSNELAVIVVAAFASLSLRRGLRFRRGSDRSFIGLYRNPTQSRLFRNLPLVLPYAAGGVLTLIAAATARYLLGSPGLLFDVVLAVSILMAVFVIPAFCVVVAIVSPRWLTPTWLREDDRLVGYESPRPSWTDRAWLVVVAMVLGPAIYFLIVVIPLISARIAEMRGG